jgi:THO complex subunit 5
MMSGAGSSADSDIERRSVTHWEETEGAREDGEVLAVPADDEPSGSAVLDSMDSEVSPVVRNHSRGISLISKSATPTKLSISDSFGRNEDDADLLMYSDSELGDQPCIHEETEKGSQGYRQILGGLCFQGVHYGIE